MTLGEYGLNLHRLQQHLLLGKIDSENCPKFGEKLRLRGPVSSEDTG